MNKLRAPPKKCEDCGQMIKNAVYLWHRAKVHDDETAAEILKELEQLPDPE